MNTLCEKLNPFLDGELAEPEADHVRGHLARCGTCAARFEDAVQLEMLAAEAFHEDGRCADTEGQAARPRPDAVTVPTGVRSPQRARRAPPPRAHHAARRNVAWGGAAVAALAALLYVSVFNVEPSAQLWLAEAPTRSIEARLSYDRVDVHRPYVAMRGGPSEVEPLPLQELARLDEKKDAIAIATAFLVHGDVAQARGYLETAPASPDRDNDLAVVAMQEGRLQEAMALLEHALRTDPQHIQALWNRALVLREQGQKERAAAAFEQLAARNEPGWSEEAGRIARELRK
ncbi:tetratricopeptide repeat protein [Hyalangium rubrum]|uniref:Tetratricopeptide repeat protein n=1 Tax=Hyalangium rubrum TaxID=3103134 RepID=A0ABU5H6Z7_9BACT|nr:tetratricopeptide repeat protein [Hyalangium sp. s54d21]MDY7228892.1 tetratricopeptide repeat protein [Hyalangium sp. s54d21]